MRLHVNQLPCPREEFEAKLAVYIQAREEHKQTRGVPAPWPEFEILRTIAERGGAVEIYEDPPAEAPPEPTAEEREAIEREMKRAAALRALDDARLAEAVKDPGAPPEVRAYAELVR